MAESSGHQELKIKIGGTELTAAQMDRVSNVRLEQSIDDHHRFEMEVLALLTSERGEFSSDALDALTDKIGQPIEVTFSEPRSSGKIEWTGLVTGAKTRVDETGAYSVVVQAASNSIKLDGNPMNAVFKEVKLSDAANTMIGDAGLTLETDSTSATFPFLHVENESAYRFLRRAYAAEGMYLFWDGVAKKMLAKKKPALGTIAVKMLDDLYEFSLDAKVMPMLSAVTTWDQAAAKSVISTVTPAKSGIPLAKTSLKVSGDIFTSVGDRAVEVHGASPKVLDDDSAGLAKTWASRSMIGRGESARVDLRAGATINVSGVSKSFAGEYLLTKVVHTISGKGYRNTFECLPADIAGPRRFPKPKQREFRVGKITDIHSPDLSGYAAKVKWSISYGGTVDETESGWLRLLMPHAGSDHGFAWMPEIDDEVLVAFEDGDLSKGVILGSLYNGKANEVATTIADGLPDNNLKVITTRSGHKLTFCDESGAEYIELVSANEECSLKMDVAGPAIIIHTNGELKVTSTKAMTFESEDSISFKAGKNIEFEAQGDFKSKSTGKTEIEGMEVNTSAQMKSSLKAGMQVEVKGGSGSVKAYAAGVDVTGPLVKLN